MPTKLEVFRDIARKSSCLKIKAFVWVCFNQLTVIGSCVLFGGKSNSLVFPFKNFEGLSLWHLSILHQHRKLLSRWFEKQCCISFATVKWESNFKDKRSGHLHVNFAVCNTACSSTCFHLPQIKPIFFLS